MIKKLNAEELALLAKSILAKGECHVCDPVAYAGWDSVPSSFDFESLELIATLKSSDSEETWEEHHPNGTSIWSPDAPIAINFHPYNRCDVYQCKKCSKLYLSYTEYGGYYIDKRIRVLDPSLIVDLAN